MHFDLKKYYTEPLYRNSIAIILNLGSGALFGLIFWLVAARTIPAEEVGLATAVVSIATLIISMSKMGLDVGMIRFLPASRGKENLYNTILLVTSALSAIMALLFIVPVEYFSPALTFMKQPAVAVAFIAYIATASASGMQNNAMIAMRKGGLSLVQNLFLAIRIPALLAIASLGVIGILSAIDVAYVVTLVYGGFVLHRLGLPMRLSLDMKEIRRIIAYSLGNYTAGILLIIPVTVMPLIIVNVVGAKEGAYFYVAYSIASVLFIIPSAVATSLFVEGSHDSPMRENTIKSLKFTLALLVPLIVFLCLFGDRVLMLFDKEYSDQAFYVLKLLAISSIFFGITSIYVTLEKVKKGLYRINLINLFIAILTIGLGYILAVYYGLAGIGYAWLLANIAVSLIVAIILIKEGI